MNEFLIISYEVASESKPALSYRFSFPYGAPVEEMFKSIDEIVAKIKSEAERIKAENDKAAAAQSEQVAENPVNS